MSIDLVKTWRPEVSSLGRAAWLCRVPDGSLGHRAPISRRKRPPYLTRGGRQAHDRPCTAPRSGDEEEGQLDAATVEKQLKSLKWHLWHGNVYRVLQLTEDLECDLDSGVDRMERVKKLL